MFLGGIENIGYHAEMVRLLFGTLQAVKSHYKVKKETKDTILKVFFFLSKCSWRLGKLRMLGSLLAC